MRGFDRRWWFSKDKTLLFVGLTDALLSEYKEAAKYNILSSMPHRHTIVDVDSVKIYHLSDWVDSEGVTGKHKTVSLVIRSLQEFLDKNKNTFDEIVIDGIFDKWKYERQYDFLFTMINACLQIINDRVCIRLNLDRSENKYNIHYLITHFFDNYNNVGVEKLSDNCYIFTFNKDRL